MSKRPAQAAEQERQRETAFTEAPAWRAVGAGWRPLFGSFRTLGYSFEWHDFITTTDLDWSRSFHPGSLELCLNLDGRATVGTEREASELGPKTIAFYYQGEPSLTGRRLAHERHRFITVEFRPDFLRQFLEPEIQNLHPCVQGALAHSAPESTIAQPEPLTLGLLQLVESLHRCPVFKSAQETWFRCKAMELAAQVFFRPPDGELFCTRQRRATNERAVRVREILAGRLETPPTLKELGQMVGCSPYHLSRQFSEASGMTIQQFIRRTRLERAAELLRTGRCNVTEAAMEVGYSSVSHFTVAFREMFGCCPGLYPLRLSTPGSAASSGAPG